MSILHPIRGRRSNEELFFEHYAQILDWASQLMRSGRADAEDLVQDFYIQVTRIHVALSEVDEIEPYLFKILRNLHYSRLRQEGRSPINDLSIVDYDSVEWGLAAVDRRSLFLVRTNLKTVCEFVCSRKNTSRAASIFILRFFMGYFPSEVMKVAQLSRVGVDKSIQFARREAQLSLDRPNAARSAVPREQSNVISGTALDDSHALFLELRQMVFRSCEGPCFAFSALEKRYRGGSPDRFTTRELAHLVSCKTCLDRANRILGLPLLDERSPDDTVGRDNPPGTGGAEGPKLSLSRGAKRTAGPKERRALDRRARGVFEHRPESLEVSVNGETRTSQRVTAEVSEFHLKLNRTEVAEFIEVFSEQRVRLAYLHVTEPTLYPGLEQLQHIDLSDGRSLDLTLSFANDLPTVHVVYRDPVFDQAAAFDDEEELYLAGPSVMKAMESVETNDSIKPESVIRFPLRQWFSAVTRKPFTAITTYMNPLLVSSTLLFVAAFTCFFLWMQSAPSITASDLLQRAERAENAPAMSAVQGVVYQKVRIKTANRSVERSLYHDASRRRKPKPQPLDQEATQLSAKLATAGLNWDEPLSAANYQDWHDRQQGRQDRITRVGDHLLALTTDVPDGVVTEQSITVRDSDFHPVGRTVVFRGNQTVEIAEVSYQVLPWSVVNPDLFEPEGTTGGTRSEMRGAPQPSVILPVAVTAEQLDEAELGVRLLLNQLHADTGEQIEVARDAQAIEVKGVVETAQRKHELQSRLRMLPHVTASLSSLDEMAASPSQSPVAASVKVASMQTRTTPLETYYLERGRSIDSLSKLSQQLFTSAFTADLESRAIDDLQHRFSTRGEMSLLASATFSDLMFSHKSNLLAALQNEKKSLEEIGIITSAMGKNRPEAMESLPLAGMSGHNLVLAKELALGTGEGHRTAEQIIPEITASMQDLSRAADAAQLIPANAQSLDKRK